MSERSYRNWSGLAADSTTSAVTEMSFLDSPIEITGDNTSVSLMQYSAHEQEMATSVLRCSCAHRLFVGEIVASGIYSFRYGGEQDRLIRAFVGLEADYDPKMVSNYVPHPYLVYALNPNTRYYYESFYGKAPSISSTAWALAAKRGAVLVDFEVTSQPSYFVEPDSPDTHRKHGYGTVIG